MTSAWWRTFGLWFGVTVWYVGLAVVAGWIAAWFLYVLWRLA